MGVSLLVVIVAATLTTSTCAGSNTKTPPVVAGKPPSAVAVEFLHARCDTTKYSKDCYDSLLPYADSFHGSHVKVARAATAILVARFRAFLSEIRRVNNTGTELMLGNCIPLIGEAINGDKETLASLSRLEAAGNGKQKQRDLEDVTKWLDKVEFKHNKCMMDVDYTKKDELLPTAAGLLESVYVARDLVKGIPL